MDPFIGEIRLMPYNFAPKGWLLCQGQTLLINGNQALFALLGTRYGGNGTTNFNLPDLRSRSHVHAGQGPGLTNYTLAQTAGTEQVTVQLSQLPVHAHQLASSVLPASTAAADQTTVSNNYYALAPTGSPQYSLDAGPNMAADVVSGTAEVAGGGGAHENRMPFQALNYCIATQGIFPSRP